MAREGGSGSKLDHHQQRAIDALLGGATIAAAAKQAKVQRNSVSRWINHDEAFRRELTRHQAHVRSGTIARVVYAQTVAVDTLLTACAKAKSWAVRVNAARALLEVTGRIDGILDDDDKSGAPKRIVWTRKEAKPAEKT